MRFLLVLAFATVTLAGTILPNKHIIGRPMTDDINAYVLDLIENEGEIEIIADHEDGTMEVAPQSIVSLQLTDMISKLQKEMPSGWPQYGIPPLAPLILREEQFDLNKGILKTVGSVFLFRVDGLDDFKINTFDLDVIFSKITFDFLIHNVTATADKYETHTIVDAMRELGLSVEYEGEGSLEIGLKNLRVAGVLKYSIPILWGSSKITSLKTQISLEECSSNISGLMGEGSINRMINSNIANFVEKGINNHSQEISDLIEENLLPKVDKMLEGNDFLTIIHKIISGSEAEDDPTI